MGYREKRKHEQRDQDWEAHIVEGIVKGVYFESSRDGLLGKTEVVVVNDAEMVVVGVEDGV